jgi:hypothetical protein
MNSKTFVRKEEVLRTGGTLWPREAKAVIGLLSIDSEI